MERRIHSLVQGSPEWHAHRANFWNASDAPAMMGVSPYKSRSDLLQEKATGIVREVDDYTQGLFDSGHRFEALARSLAEEVVGSDLYPVSISNGKLAASLDGLTIGEDVQWEHKSINDAIRAAESAADLPLYLRVQMEHQYAVSGAERCLFQATCWDDAGNLLEEIHHWYEPDLDLREQIISGWDQFERDLAAYQPRELAEKPQADAIMSLPALAVQIRGEVITSNLPAFRSAAERFIASIKTTLETDQDFADAEATVKFCEAAEKDLEVAKNAALAQTSSIDELMRTVDHIKAQLRDKRLALDKLVTRRKTEIKEDIISDGRKAYAAHVATLNAELGAVAIVMPAPDFVAAAKNKRTLASLHDAVDTALANGKIAADEAARDLRGKLEWFREAAADHEFLFRDLQPLIQKPTDDFKLAVTTRIAEHKRVEAEREEQRKAAEAAAAQQAAAPAPAAPVPVASAPVKTAPMPARVAPAVAAPSGAPTLRLGQINERLAPIALTADGLASLGFPHAATDKTARLYHEEAFPRICEALIRHLHAAVGLELSE